MCELAQKNLLLNKVVTILPSSVVLGKLAPASSRFRQVFAQELALSEETAKSDFLARVDALLEPYLAQISRKF